MGQSLLDRTADPAPEPPVLESVAPIVPVRHVPHSVHFYTEIMGFELVAMNRAETSALLRRGPVRLMVMNLGDMRAPVATGEYFSCYVWVSGLDALFSGLQAKLAMIPPDRVTRPYSRADGLREFSVRDPDGFMLIFGESRAG